MLMFASTSEAYVKQQGKASFHPYGNSQMITASRVYPCGTIIKVFNKANKKWVKVKVKDWGPAAWTGRSLDLNKAAFARIADTKSGQINVSYYVLKRGDCKLHRH